MALSIRPNDGMSLLERQLVKVHRVEPCEVFTNTGREA
jgi:hypothetical protein